MHLLLIFISLLLAYGLRILSQFISKKYQQKWGLSLFLFAFPTLILLMTCIAIICMGYQGEMWGIKASKLSYYLSISFLIYALFTLVKNTLDHLKTWSILQQCSVQKINNYKFKLLETDFPYAAQIGFWNSQLVLSQGLIKLLSQEHLLAVIAHESAHKKCRDPFLFFWLFYLKKLGFCLPNNEQLWDNLILLRELRADQIAAKKVDYLLIAESLIQVTSSIMTLPSEFNHNLECTFYDNRLQVRIDNLMAEKEDLVNNNYLEIIWLLFIFIPWLFFPFHNPC
ncbi:M56 family metallopeptidase [Cyanobacterium aponinum UTEX 3221]|uniref:Peptidase M48 Ste24p n=1 Tax=Cyanobacterium aponinum (strain PCC 10605) TaxID=755178 RepID=K9Z4Q2_CYAAP|nr:M56 family metallopeptidase [Cyanobacterium aponinum]AFZ53383.1 peptidase M48 Ste24p [Cyanobacterium aponinum PCC 10605]MBD2395751.1 M56 family metallopeptidase [Cyanobacterium aponinum FACHB-4101]WRL37775.1 M56 family metallopeptidase [Cyanobacterium aponinum UTEX 3221]